MASPIDFYFDFSSPYGYLASEKIDDLAARHGREVSWHPILLGAVFKATGGVPLTQLPIKGEYYAHDFARSARFLGVPFSLPQPFPVATQAAARTYYWLEDQDRGLARNFAHAVYRAYFAEGIDIAQPEKVRAIATSLGVDGAALDAALGDPAVKDRLRIETDAALARGVCGSPFYLVDGEPFWGSDRLAQLDKWLETGGF